ncbi:hypothetical protein [Chelativorans intermedius]|nr:hypothetical protein [Chelativorans intermedius]MCT8997415.1 hypothetical protein [Chelativorans intermedius]
MSPEDAGARDAGEAERTCVLVLGMHRSGTSAMTRVFSLLGCDLPANLMGANETNKAGHWESTAICRFNDRVLESAGSCWHDWQAFHPGWLRSPKARTFREEALGVLEQEFGGSRLFVLKDPRICRLAPFWLDVLAAAGARPLVVLPLRNPLEVAASLQKRNGFEPAFGHLLWLRHVLAAEAATRGLARIFLGYDSMLRSWARVVERAEERFGLSLPRKSSAATAEIEAFLTDKLRHHREASESVVENPALSRWLRDSYRILSRWAEEGEDAADHAALDAILAEFDAAAPAFAQLADAGHAAIGRARRLEGELEQSRARLAEKEGQFTQLQADLVAANARAQEAAAARDARGEELARLQSALDEAQKKAAAGEGRIATLEAELAAARDAAARAEEALEAAEKAAAEARGELQQTRSALEQRRHEAEETAEALRQARERLADAETARAAQAKLAEGFKEHVELLITEMRERRAANAGLEEVRRKFEAEQEALSSRLNGELAEVTQRLKAREEELAAARREAEEARAQARQEAEARRAEAEKAAARSRELSSRLDARFDEIAQMSRLLRAREAEAEAGRARAEQAAAQAAVELGRAVTALMEDRRHPLFWAQARLRRAIAIVRRSGLFDAEWYRSHYPDVAQSDVEPIKHYVLFGAREGRRPNGRLKG